jgi:Zn-dependent protease with chaperone function
MDREYLLEILIAVIGGVALFASGWWPARSDYQASGVSRERVAWNGIWLPLVPLALSVAWLIGWALVEPDPTEAAPVALFIAAVPFVILFTRATARAVRSLVRETREHGAAIVGVLRPRILISPRLAEALQDRELEAVVEHERAHAQHRDPLRVWLAQLATDLQWPWPQARVRFRAWIHALELARSRRHRFLAEEHGRLWGGF